MFDGLQAAQEVDAGIQLEAVRQAALSVVICTPALDPYRLFVASKSGRLIALASVAGERSG